MDPDSWLVWLGLLGAVLVVAFSNAGRASLGGLSKANLRRLRGEGASRADALLALIEDPGRFVLALQILDVLGIVAAIAAIVWLALNAGLVWRWQMLILVLVKMHDMMMGQTMPMTGTMPAMDHSMPMTGTMATMDHSIPMTETMAMAGDSMGSPEMMGQMMICLLYTSPSPRD